MFYGHTECGLNSILWEARQERRTWLILIYKVLQKSVFDLNIYFLWFIIAHTVLILIELSNGNYHICRLQISYLIPLKQLNDKSSLRFTSTLTI